MQKKIDIEGECVYSICGGISIYLIQSTGSAQKAENIIKTAAKHMNTDTLKKMIGLRNHC